LRTVSVISQRWPGVNVTAEGPLRLPWSTQRSPWLLVTLNTTSEPEPPRTSSRSCVVRSSVVLMGEVTVTVVYDVSEYVPANSPAPRFCAKDGSARSATALARDQATGHACRFMGSIFAPSRAEIKRE
jgi:hypothetical protein